MAVFQYQCGSCSAVFEQLVMLAGMPAVDCLNCCSSNIGRLETTYFYPNKNFCPHDKELDKDKLKVQLAGIMSDQSLRCGGCGTDGAPGSCSTGKKGGCGSGGCGGCGSGGGCGTKKKLSLDISSPLI